MLKKILVLSLVMLAAAMSGCGGEGEVAELDTGASAGPYCARGVVLAPCSWFEPK